MNSICPSSRLLINNPASRILFEIICWNPIEVTGISLSGNSFWNGSPSRRDTHCEQLAILAGLC